MLDWDKWLLISIGGGHATGVDKVAKKLEESITKVFTNAYVTIIDLDKIMEQSDSKRTYSDKDINFEEIFSGLNGISHKGIDVIILCGCYALYNKMINKRSKLKIFLDSDNDKRLINIIKRSKTGTPDELSVIIAEYMDHLRPEMMKYIEPTRVYADMIIPYENEAVGSDILLDGVVKAIQEIDGGDNRSKTVPVWNYETEQMDVQKERYYDLS
ncbi:similar to Saccharomyces cerevisiae YDR020C DAS2 Putative protein of unknown function [Maudiozyma barnettii]|uniref:Phosphoribulokinase/uridine kinase domain-containing protein n=1 Tax=Maudiozyma barnettii TaxID=61262 RepID=A0A8H2VD64_9SACH|nr:putative uridine kinase DAS2 [Kazachstania barnettii]CAB4253140.1 similar to Saccharomyces cerevisiae YDR020C DAS2 Putative protein of unknown function [Kazachstania barnettii]CAD1780324.1 similar to Saccharomyces cerevisiae YDR020C DAS2 Putative protein of unknown function [Kazachstania barnettii]